MSIFNLAVPRQGTPVTYWYAAKNIPWGMAHAERILVDEGGSRLAKSLEGDERALLEFLSTVGGPGIPDVAERIAHRRVIEALHYLRISKMNRVWTQAYGHLSKQSEWLKDNVQIFLTGGGAGVPHVWNEFSRSWMDAWGPHPVRPLPTPHDYVASGVEAPFERLSVAYGLSVPAPLLNEYVLPDDSPDHTPPRLQALSLRDRHDVDVVYPTSNWLR